MKAQACLRHLAICLALPALAACSGMLASDRPAVETWWLAPLAGGSVQGASASAPALALELGVVPGLDTDRILTIGTDAQLNHFAAARWPDNLPDVLQSVIRRSLVSSGLFSTVSRRGASREGACSMQLEVQAFFAILDAGGAPHSVRVEMEGDLVCDTGARRLHAAGNAGTGANSMSDVVAAFQSALDDATRALLIRVSAQ